MTAPDEGEATAARIREASALRRLGHALAGNHCDDDVLDALAADAKRGPRPWKPVRRDRARWTL